MKNPASMLPGLWQRLGESDRQRLRLALGYVLFQVLNLVCVLLAALAGACILAAVLALRGQTIDHLLPWFLVLALPIWLIASFVVYALLQPRAPARRRPASTSGPANDDSSEPAQDKVTPLRRLFSL